jgi:hypothetical protein
MSAAPYVQIGFSAGAEAMRCMEEQRKAREDRMRNALEILAYTHAETPEAKDGLARFVRATAREGLGRE